MARKTRKSASSTARAKAKAKARAASPRKKTKKPLTMKEMLERVPKKEYLSTREVQHVFNDAHEVTIYRWVKAKELKAYRVRSRGKANVYKQAEVIEAIKARFTPRPANKIRETETDAARDQEATPSKPKPRKNSKARKGRKPRTT